MPRGVVPLGEAFEVLSDCRVCRVEAAVVELCDPGAASGVALLARCRLCGFEERLGRVIQPGQRPNDAVEARAALIRWAEAEGETSLEIFCEGSFLGLAPDEVASRLVAGEVVGTSFDVLAWLFGGQGASGCTPPCAGGGGGEPRLAVELASPMAPAPVAPEPPFQLARAMASVIYADGREGAAERRYADRYLAEHGQPPFAPEDLRVWRPLELGRPADPAPIVEALARLCWADGVRDETEWRVVREYARAWDYPLVRLARLDRALERRFAPTGRRLWLWIRSLFVVEPP